ncbi:FKBP-type peptidyl-prolyl cis-trans isomerase [Henriciella aquimarina]|uniref:FKBP-type peptidyl-prolyl cis-trans isomerase n=1 Tax=Henriciella aquimarina TaxID=545261 RepID=UPI0009FD4F22|nr:FKBP-type peptidyl-prolyl cis-trans isomerase [Henriciella aquimarina]
MFRRLSTALIALTLAACGGQTSADFESYFPWDPEAQEMQETDSGLQYLVVEEGPEDAPSPEIDSTVQVFYEGRLPDGTVFDGNFDSKRPAIFGVGQVIPGWTQGLQLMSEGDEYIFYIPSRLGYGDSPRPGGKIKPGDDLVFRVQLQKVFEPKPADAEAWSEYTPWDSSNEDVQKTDSGLEYVVLESGDESGKSPTPSDTAVVYYEGRFAENGEVFDSAFQRGEPIMFKPGEVIPGWKEALTMMKPGDRWLIHIPSALGYGERGYPGAIPPNSDLDFEVELVDVLQGE